MDLLFPGHRQATPKVLGRPLGFPQRAASGEPRAQPARLAPPGSAHTPRGPSGRAVLVPGGRRQPALRPEPSIAPPRLGTCVLGGPGLPSPPQHSSRCASLRGGLCHPSRPPGAVAGTGPAPTPRSIPRSAHRASAAPATPSTTRARATSPAPRSRFTAHDPSGRPGGARRSRRTGRGPPTRPRAPHRTRPGCLPSPPAAPASLSAPGFPEL